jgi:hypothetical protein
LPERQLDAPQGAQETTVGLRREGGEDAVGGRRVGLLADGGSWLTASDRKVD